MTVKEKGEAEEHGRLTQTTIRVKSETLRDRCGHPHANGALSRVSVHNSGFIEAGKLNMPPYDRWRRRA
jgi:hypothetical protein